ncbi:MAG TPA: hemolysin family protein, partial [Chloroflexota bacterium]|nr:hemolysin family protein [Chloroflexota bacterium]
AIRLVTTVAIIAANTLLVALFISPLSEAVGGELGAIILLGTIMLVVAVVLIQQIGHAFGLKHAEAVALGLAGPMRIVVLVLSPFVKAVDAIGGFIYRPPGQTSRDSSSGGVTEAGIMLQVDVAEEEGVLEEDEGEMIRSIFEFGDTIVREIMVPRIDMQAAEGTMKLGQVVDQAIKAGHSRVPIYDGTMDRVLGIFYVKDALRFLREGYLNVDIREVMRPAYFVPETKKVDELLREMQTRRVHLAIIVDEYGGTAGLVTIEDILEEIVGEIQDEFDPEHVTVHQINEYETVIDAIMTLDDVNDVLSLQLEDEEVDTLGGYVYSKLGRVPEQGDEVAENGLRLIADTVEGNRITRVRIIRLPDQDQPGRAGETEFPVVHTGATPTETDANGDGLATAPEAAGTPPVENGTAAPVSDSAGPNGSSHGSTSQSRSGSA